MKVSEFVKNYDGNVKLGARDGGAFIYCGAASEADFAAIDEDRMKTLQTSLKSAIQQKNRIENKPKTYKEFLELKSNEPRGKKDFSEEEFGKELEKDKKDLEKIIKKIQEIEDTIENYVSIADREIVDKYKALLEDSLIIRFEGTENGRYWDMEEYEEAHSQ